MNRLFNTAKQRGISLLMKFASIKESRINVLKHRLTTDQLEGYNKIKILKRSGCSYRNEEHLFVLIKCLSLPAN